MTKSRKFVQPGCLSRENTRYKNIRQINMERNAALLSSLGIKSNLSAMKKNSELEKSKMGSLNDDEEYKPVEGEEGMSSFSEGVVSSRLQGKKVCRTPRKKKGGHATHISRTSQPRCTNTSTPAGETQVVPRQALTPLVDHVKSMPEAATQPTQFTTSSTQPHQLPSPAPTSVVVNITYPLPEEQISINVLGKRSVYVKEYGSCRSTISSSKQPQEVDVLQQKLDDQAKTLTKNSHTLAKYSQTMTVVQGLIQVLAAKAGIDPAEVQKLIDGSNTAEGTSGEEDGVARKSSEEVDAAGISEEKDDATSTG